MLARRKIMQIQLDGYAFCRGQKAWPYQRFSPEILQVHYLCSAFFRPWPTQQS